MPLLVIGNASSADPTPHRASQKLIIGRHAIRASLARAFNHPGMPVLNAATHVNAQGQSGTDAPLRRRISLDVA
jgi:hypothetical protein